MQLQGQSIYAYNNEEHTPYNLHYFQSFRLGKWVCNESNRNIEEIYDLPIQKKKQSEKKFLYMS